MGEIYCTILEDENHSESSRAASKFQGSCWNSWDNSNKLVEEHFITEARNVQVAARGCRTTKETRNQMNTDLSDYLE